MKNRKLYKGGFGVVALMAILSLNLFFTEKEDISTNIITEKVIEKEPVIKYGLPIDSFHVHRSKIKPGQFLADILLKHHISYPEIDKLVKAAKPVYDVRNMVAGKKITVLTQKDSIEKARYLIYEQNSINYVVFDLGELPKATRGAKEVVIKEKQVFGSISSSLYETLLENNAHAELAEKLSEIYAWSIDFYRIQKGDYFSVIYEEQYVEGKPIGVGRIKSANFNHRHTDFYAFNFEQDGTTDFYDENGNSLRKAFLKAPLKFSRISSRFTLRRFHPVQKRYKAHLGTDYAAPTGTPIMAVGDGVVKEAKYKKYNGNYVKIKHNGTYTTQYLHMSKIAAGMRPGKMVRQGDIIGYVGSTGLATGPHVCYRFWKNGKQVDPLKEKFPASKPIKVANKAIFEEIINEMKPQLARLANPKVIS